MITFNISGAVMGVFLSCQIVIFLNLGKIFANVSKKFVKLKVYKELWLLTLCTL